MINEIFNIKTEKQFKEIVFKAFDYQMDNNPIYAAYAALILKGSAPKVISEIPFLPISFFKSNQIICKGKAVEKVFLSSGTSGEQSKHLVADISIYKESYLKSFEQFYDNIDQYCVLSLLPNYREREGSSLIYMVDDLIAKSTHFK